MANQVQTAIDELAAAGGGRQGPDAAQEARTDLSAQRLPQLGVHDVPTAHSIYLAENLQGGAAGS
ncbi:MAG: hypothetical protein VX733_14810 [Candidatus Latescibacterota bacterium]|nr:hypothetical protein [Candidatus Latescibacterota bacterium]